MDSTELFTEDRGVSPVIGVILMVAITVILAAVIGAFVLGLGGQFSNSPPTASFEFDFEGQESVEISHGGGDDIENDTVTVDIDGTEAFPENGTAFNMTGWEDTTISTGDSVAIANNTSNSEVVIDGGETIRVIWNNPSGGSSNTIGEREWPN